MAPTYYLHPSTIVTAEALKCDHQKGLANIHQEQEVLSTSQSLQLGGIDCDHHYKQRLTFAKGEA
jgi:hypothetical protein